jgi:RNA polymerase sigma-70 factor (ECF subfamily)
VKEESLDPEESMQKDERVQRMRDVVEKLKPRYKRLVELRYLEEKSYEEISEILELPLGTVKAQLFRARDFMFELMKNTKGTF